VEPDRIGGPRVPEAAQDEAPVLADQDQEPGGEERYLGDGDQIRFTQSALVLEKIIGQFLYSRAAEGGGK